MKRINSSGIADSEGSKTMKERGQSLVEFGISLVILLYLLSGAAEFGVLLFQYVQLRDAAQEGALYGSMNPYIDSNVNGKFDAGEPVNRAGIEARARAASNKPINLSDAGLVTITPSSADGTGLFCEGHGVTVLVEFDHQIFMPFLPQILNQKKIHLSATVTDTILTPVC
jgi:Flp pilus assembly protein TadG